MNKIKKLWNEWAVPVAAGIGIGGGLFVFCLILGVIFADYDPRTMLKAIAEDLEMLFGINKF